jgi:hypothetical protein
MSLCGLFYAPTVTTLLLSIFACVVRRFSILSPCSSCCMLVFFVWCCPICFHYPSCALLCVCILFSLLLTSVSVLTSSHFSLAVSVRGLGQRFGAQLFRAHCRHSYWLTGRHHHLAVLGDARCLSDRMSTLIFPYSLGSFRGAPPIDLTEISTPERHWKVRWLRRLEAHHVFECCSSCLLSTAALAAQEGANGNQLSIYQEHRPRSCAASLTPVFDCVLSIFPSSAAYKVFLTSDVK